MNNFKKLGLTALAGSLVASTAFAGSMDVSGSAKVSYKSKDGQGVSGAPMSNDKAITFSGSGDLDNGMTVSTAYTMDDVAFSTSQVVLDMGDSGTLSFMNGVSLAGLNKYQDVMPTAGEQVWDDIGDDEDYGVVGTGNSNSLGYEVSFNNLTASASMTKAATGTESSLVLIANDLIDGVQLGYGIGKDASSVLVEDDHSTMWAKYTIGGVTLGVQDSSIDKATDDIDRTAAAISFAVNENISVSYGISDVDFEDASLVDEESSGISASYTLGGMTVGAIMNKTDNVGGSTGVEGTYTEFSVAFAF